LAHEAHELAGARAELDRRPTHPGHEPDLLPRTEGPTERGLRVIERKKSLEVTAQALELELAPVLALVGAQPKQEAQPGAVAVCDLCRIDHELARRVLVDPAHRIPPDAACGLDVEATGKAQAERPLRT